MVNNLTLIENVEIPETIKREILSKNSQIIRILDGHNLMFDQWFSNIFGKNVITESSWVNYVRYDPGIYNGYGWHNEKGQGGSGSSMSGDWVGIIWISGEENHGGNLMILDSDEIQEIKFKPNTAIVIPSTMLHKVEHYYGVSDRISLNFTFDIV